MDYNPDEYEIVVSVRPKKKLKREPNPLFMKPLHYSTELEAVIGPGPLPRTHIIKKLWAYIKKHDLQDSRNRRMINADEALMKIFDRRQVSMFEMNKLVNKHIEPLMRKKRNG